MLSDNTMTLRHAMISTGRRAVLASICGGIFVATSAYAQTNSDPDSWPDLAAQIFPSKVLQDGSTLLAIDAPYRAEDAAVVPITLRTTFGASDTRQLRSITLVIDVNPSPVAVTFTIGQNSGIDSISTRIRVNDYTNVHAVAELSDGKFYVVSRYIKAAGGCSAPALKQSTDNIPLGTLKFREFPPSAAGKREAQVMFRHPNYSGMQLDQVSRLYTPAYFLRKMQIWEGDHLLIKLESGISISENPTFRFNFLPSNNPMQNKDFRVEAIDSEDQHFSHHFQKASTTM